MRFWKKTRNALALLTLAALAACGRADDAPQFSIAAARLEQRSDAVWLIGECRWQPSAAMLEGLDHGIALTLDIRVQAQSDRAFAGVLPRSTSARRLELRYFPLTRQYQWRDLERGSVRSYALRSAALSALERLELSLGDAFPLDAPRYAVRVELDNETLPGALRLPAMIRAEWRQPAAEFDWRGPRG